MPENREQKTNRPVNRNQNANKQKSRKKTMRNLILMIILLVVLIAVVIVLTISCGRKKEKPVDIVVPTEITETETKPQIQETILNEKPVSLYTMDYGTMTCNKVSSISKEWSEYEDLEAFGAFATNEESFEFSSETEAHNEIWNRASTEKTYKIGYELSFDVNGEHKIITILKPGDIENNPDLYNGDYPEDEDYSGITGYMGAWVYDDMHQNGGFYIHITQAEVTEETLLTSIKLRPTPQSDQIENLVLKGFSYSSEIEFDSNGHYIGSYGASVAIHKQ